MVQGLNTADDGSGLLEQARARLANLIQLRLGGDIDQPETVLSFESALDNANFDAAFAAATMWSAAGLDGLGSWLSAAQRRNDLDQAVNRLVAYLCKMPLDKIDVCQITILFVLIMLAAGLASWLMAQPGNLSIEWLGWQMEMRSSLAVTLVIVFALFLVFFDRLQRALWSMPGWLGGRWRERRDTAGHRYSLGLMAVSAGEPIEARKQARAHGGY